MRKKAGRHRHMKFSGTVASLARRLIVEVFHLSVALTTHKHAVRCYIIAGGIAISKFYCLTSC